MPDSGTDPLSPLAHDIIKAATYEKLVAPSHTPAASRELLGSVSADQLLTVPITNWPAAMAMLAGLWLWHDGLTDCHEIVQKSPEDLERAALYLHSKPSKTSQNVPLVQSVESHKALGRNQLQEITETLSFWHAIMHRREGDFSNSKYWYDRVSRHPMLPVIGAAVAASINPLPADKSLVRLLAGGWSPHALVDLVQDVTSRPNDPRRAVVVEVQRIEWRVLFDHCTRQAQAGT